MHLGEAMICREAGDRGDSCNCLGKDHIAASAEAGAARKCSHRSVTFIAFFNFAFTIVHAGCVQRVVAPKLCSSEHLAIPVTTEYERRPLMPDLRKLPRQQSRWLRLSTSVLGTLTRGLTVDLQIEVVNPTTKPVGLLIFDYEQPERRFAIWLMKDRDQVELTGYGKQVQPRMTDGPWCSGGPTAFIDKSRPHAMHVDLTKLFELSNAQPGEFTVVVKDGLFFNGTDNSPTSQTGTKNATTFKDANGAIVERCSDESRQSDSFGGFGGAMTAFEIGN